MHIWYYWGMKHSDSITLNLSRICKDWDIDRSTASRGLKALESVGLITVERLKGRKPIIKICDVSAKCNSPQNG